MLSNNPQGFYFLGPPLRWLKSDTQRMGIGPFSGLELGQVTKNLMRNALEGDPIAGVGK